MAAGCPAPGSPTTRRDRLMTPTLAPGDIVITSRVTRAPPSATLVKAILRKARCRTREILWHTIGAAVLRPFSGWSRLLVDRLITESFVPASARGSCAPEFSWTLDCERVLAGGVSRWGSTIRCRRRRRKPGGRPEGPLGAAVGDDFRPGASARQCCVCCAERISSPCRGSWGSRRRRRARVATTVRPRLQLPR